MDQLEFPAKLKRHSVLFVILSLFSCNPQPSTSSSDQTSNIPFSGYWVNEGYYEDLMLKRSPKMAQNESRCIYIPDSTGKATQFIYNFHEGSGAIQVRNNNGHFSIWFNLSDSSEQFLDSIILNTSNRIRIGKNYFRKVEAFPKFNNYFIPEALLFQGNYLMEDGNQIHFSNDRRIKGWDAHTYYEVQSDYYDAGLQVDQIALGKNDSAKTWYGFKFSNDSLLIYTLNCLERDVEHNFCLDVEFGKLKYALKKVKSN